MAKAACLLCATLARPPAACRAAAYFPMGKRRGMRRGGCTHSTECPGEFGASESLLAPSNRLITHRAMHWRHPWRTLAANCSPWEVGYLGSWVDEYSQNRNTAGKRCTTVISKYEVSVSLKLDRSTHSLPGQILVNRHVNQLRPCSN